LPTLTITTTTATPAGDTITGTSGSVTATTIITLEVNN
jgi:hypothetical protein